MCWASRTRGIYYGCVSIICQFILQSEILRYSIKSHDWHLVRLWNSSGSKSSVSRYCLAHSAKQYLGTFQQFTRTTHTLHNSMSEQCFYDVIFAVCCLTTYNLFCLIRGQRKSGTEENAKQRAHIGHDLGSLELSALQQDNP